MELHIKTNANGEFDDELSLDLTVRELVNLRTSLRKYIVSEQLKVENIQKNISKLMEQKQADADEIEHANALMEFHIENVVEIQGMLDDLER